VLTPIEDGAPTVLVGIENVFEVRSVSIEKVTDGPGAEFWGDGPFTLHQQCVLADDTGNRTVWDGDLVVPTPVGLWSTVKLLVRVVPEPDRGFANSLLFGTENAANTAGPGLGGFVGQLFGPVKGMLGEVVGVAVSLVCLIFIRPQPAPAATTR
ncbi:hypothetical protein ACWKWP_17475, partial [Agromyces soli]